MSPEDGPGGPESERHSDDAPGAPAGPRRALRVAYLLVPLFGIWLLFAEVFPSPVGVYVTGVPFLAVLFAISGIVFLLALARASPRWMPAYRASVAVGAAAGLVVAGGLAAVALAQGCPYLPPLSASEPGGWTKVSAPAWRAGGAPVLFFYGSVACPFCSASSWAILAALDRLGNVSGLAFDRSSPTDAYPGTPEVVLPNLAVSSPYVTFLARESTNDQQIEAPSLGSCVERAYVSAYSQGGIPFAVVDGVYVHTGTLVDPATLAGLNASAIANAVRAESGPGWTAVASAAYLLMALLVKANGGQPASLARSPPVAAALAALG
jgi:hypothetical protein